MVLLGKVITSKLQTDNNSLNTVNAFRAHGVFLPLQNILCLMIFLILCCNRHFVSSTHKLSEGCSCLSMILQKSLIQEFKK